MSTVVMSSGLAWPLRKITLNLAPARVQSVNQPATWGFVAW